MRAPSSASSVIRRSSSRTPSARLTTQSAPPGSTLPRSLSPSNEPPVMGNVRRVPRGPAPMFCVGAVLSRRVIRGRERMEVLLSARARERDGGDGASMDAGTHPASVANAASWRTLLRRAYTRASQDLVDRVDGASDAPVSARHGEESIQELVLRVAGLEARKGPEVVRRRVDALAPRERRDDFRWPVAKAERCHVDERTIVGLEGDTQIELEDSVPSEERPIAAAGQHLSTQPRALEPT